MIRRTIIECAMFLCVFCGVAHATNDTESLDSSNVPPWELNWGKLSDFVLPALAIVKTPGGSGSGFVVQFGGKDSKKYLVTNEHVSRGGAPIELISIQGAKIEVVSIEPANVGDLVRMELKDQSFQGALKIGLNQQSIGADVCIYGNSDGAGVATEISGKILGVGPDRIEVSADFVRGNSGSPIVFTDGLVAGVATYVMKTPGIDWVKEGTRFQETRRFGMRLDVVKWVPVSSNEYYAQVNALADLLTYCVEVQDLLASGKYAGAGTYRTKGKYKEQLQAVAVALADYEKKLIGVSGVPIWMENLTLARAATSRDPKDKEEAKRILKSREKEDDKQKAFRIVSEYRKKIGFANLVSVVSGFRKANWATEDFQNECSYMLQFIDEITKK